MTPSMSQEQLCSFIKRLLRKHGEKDQVSEDIREIYAEARSQGFDKTALGAVVRHVRKVTANPEKEQEHSALFDTYLFAYEQKKDEIDETASRAHVRARAREDKPPTELQRRYGMGGQA